MFENEEYKFNAIIEDIKDCVAHAINRFLLVLYLLKNLKCFLKALDKAGIKHNVLNAKFHAQEAEIVAERRCPGAVTIANQYWQVVVPILSSVVTGKQKPQNWRTQHQSKLRQSKLSGGKNHEIVMPGR